MSATSELNEIEIMPRRLMNAKNGEALISVLSEDKRIIDVLVHGPKYHDGGQVVGRFIIRISPDSVADNILESFKPSFQSAMPYGYDVRIGRFTKPKPTVKDYLSGRMQR